MPRKLKFSKLKGGNCPPGTFCIENMTMIFLFILLAIGAYFIYMMTYNPKQMYYNPNAEVMHHHNNNGPHFHTNDEIKNHLMFNVSSQSAYDMLRPLADPRISVSSDPKDTLLNPYSPPIHVNQPHAYKQIGYLKSDSHGHNMFPLFAKPQHLRRDKWYYYTIYDNNLLLFNIY